MSRAGAGTEGGQAGVGAPGAKGGGAGPGLWSLREGGPGPEFLGLREEGLGPRFLSLREEERLGSGLPGPREEEEDEAGFSFENEISAYPGSVIN